MVFHTGKKKCSHRRMCGSFRGAAPFVEHFMVLYNLTRGNILKDQAIPDIKRCCLNINSVTVKAINSIVWSKFSLSRRSNTKDLKNSSCQWNFAMKPSGAVSLIQMMCKHLNKFFTWFYGVSYYFSKTLTEVALEGKIYKCFYWNLRKNDGKCLRWRPFLVMMTEHVVQRY